MSEGSLVEIHKQGVVVATLLGGFTMSFAFQSFAKTWESRFHKYSAIAALISSLCFIIVVCLSALVLFVISDIEARIGHALEVAGTGFVWGLAVMNLLSGTVGMLSLFTMFALIGWEQNRTLGWFTTISSLVGVLFLIIGFLIVYFRYSLPNYGDILYLPW